MLGGRLEELRIPQVGGADVGARMRRYPTTVFASGFRGAVVCRWRGQPRRRIRSRLAQCAAVKGRDCRGNLVRP